jgi:predicted dehydrogenase
VGLRMGAIMLRTLYHHPRADVRAICDLEESLARDLAARYDVPHIYQDYDQMLAEEPLDGVLISTPNRMHTPMVRAALDRKLHVLCEKPLTLDTAEARALVAQANKVGITHGTNFSNRPSPAVRYVKEQIDSGALGRIYEVHLSYLQDFLSDPAVGYTWRNNKEASGSGALGDTGSHLLDMARLFVGEVASVSARLGIMIPHRTRPDGSIGTVDADDLTVMHLQYVNGALGTLRATRVARGRCDLRRIEIYGEHASLVLELDTNRSRVLRADEPTKWTGDGFREVFATDARISTWGGNTIAWVDAALAGQQMHPNFEDGLRCQEILDAAVRSDAERRWVDV